MRKELIISPKGQITLPREAREKLGLRSGDAVVFTVVRNEIIMTPKSINFNDLAGFLGKPPAGAATLEEIDATVRDAAGLNAMPVTFSHKDEAA